jgi:hypothetical protein
VHPRRVDVEGKKWGAGDVQTAEPPVNMR